MISLCTNYDLILSALNNQVGSEYIREYIRLYLDSYGTEYDFQDFFLQKDTESGNVTAIVLRYNDQIYASVSKDADLSELCIFLSGFSHCAVIADKILKSHFPEYDICYVMRKKGEAFDEFSPDVRQSDAHKDIAVLVGESLSRTEKMDYYLNLSHQMRHDKIRAYSYCIDTIPVSVVILSTVSPQLHIITTVYTQEHFRGNGYAKQILDQICYDTSKEYLLLCEEHNLNFYKKCGFSETNTCIRFRL